MPISDLLFETEVSIKQYLETGHYGDSDDPVRQEIEQLLAHMEAVRQLLGLDCPPDDELAKSQSAAIHKSFGPPSEDCEAARETHLEANNQIVKIGEPFTVGGYECDYPGDDALPP